MMAESPRFLTAFVTAVGYVMQHVNANQGWIAIAKTRVTEHKHTSHGFFTKKVTVTEDAYTKPNWILVTPNQMTPGYDVGFKVPVAGSTPLQISTCQQENPRSLGQPTQTSSGGAAIKIVAGATFLHEGFGSNLPQGEIHSFHHSKSKKGLGFIGILVVTLVTGGALAPIWVGIYNYVLNHPAVTAEAGRGSRATNQTTAGSTLFQRQTSVQQSVSGGSSSPASSSSSVLDSSTLTSTAYTGGNTTGSITSGHTQNPMQQTSEWDPYPAVADNVLKGYGMSGAGFTQGADHVRPAMSAIKGKVALSTIRQQTAELLNFKTQIGNILPGF